MVKPLRISFILSSLWLSGGNRVIVEYANRLAARGHSIALVIPGGTLDASLAPEIVPSVRVIESQVQRQPRTGALNMAQLSWSLAAAVPSSDLLLSTHTPTTVAGWLAGRVMRKGRLLWLYQDYLEMFNGRRAERWLLQNALRWHDAALVVSHFSRSELASFYPGNIQYIGEGLSHADAFLPVAFAERPPEHRYTILTMGDPRPRKGFADFLQAVETVRIHCPQIKLWIIAKEECEVPTTVAHQFFFRPTRTEMAQLYATCGLFVLASWWESFGLPPLEAMACAAPVVVTDSRGVGDYAVDRHNCLLVPPRHPTELAKAMVTLLTDDRLCAQLSSHGPATAQRFDWEAAVDRFERAILEHINPS